MPIQETLLSYRQKTEIAPGLSSGFRFCPVIDMKIIDDKIAQIGYGFVLVILIQQIVKQPAARILSHRLDKLPKHMVFYCRTKCARRFLAQASSLLPGSTGRSSP
jgi:hypothetical protein